MSFTHWESRREREEDDVAVGESEAGTGSQTGDDRVPSVTLWRRGERGVSQGCHRGAQRPWTGLSEAETSLRAKKFRLGCDDPPMACPVRDL